jgi:gamma-glutamylputrescine oxidase
MTFNANLDFERSYYLATAKAAERFASLSGPVEADVVVVGGGATGLSAALHAREAGLSAALLEGGRIGWGASGRNGGQIIPGLRKGAHELVRLYGRERGKALFDLAIEARDLVASLVARHAIDCDLSLTGHLEAAVKPTHFREMEAEVRCLNDVMRYPHAELVDAVGARAIVDTPYVGGLLDEAGGHFHPLNYALGLARAAHSAGVMLFEDCVARKLTRDGDFVTIATDGGQVRARHAVLAGDAYLAGLSRAEDWIMPVGSYIAVTAPLGEAAAALIPSNAAVSDSRFVVNYYRLTADNRLLYGGRERYSPAAPGDIAAFVRPRIEETFPSLKGVAIDHAWGGLVSITMSRLPHLARDGNILIAQGYSGLGAILSTLAGKLVAEDIAGRSERFDRFAAVAPPRFPGGPALRGPLHVLGMLWYALRDRL